MTTAENRERFAPPEALGPLARRCFRVAAVAGFLSLCVALVDIAGFVRSYLVAYLFLVSIAGGCLALILIQFLTGGHWGIVSRRIFGAAARTLPWLLVGFAPVLLGLRAAYAWADPALVAADPILRYKAAYLNGPFFALRTLFYFAVWWGVLKLLDRVATEQELNPDESQRRRLTHTAAGGLVAYAATTTFAGIDWLMSLDPHWFSSLYGVYFMGGQALAGFAFLIPVAALLQRWSPMREALAPRHFHDFGKLLFAFLMLWAYFSYSQFLIIWSGNLPEEVGWYLTRTAGLYRAVSLGIILLHFALPFVLLLSAGLKRNPKLLAAVAGLILGMRYVDLWWQAKPAFHHGHGLHLQDPLLLVALGAAWLGLFLRELGKRPLLPVGEPTLEEAIGHA